ncbi:MAG: DUF5996 family protein [Acidimicrobiales bacterium]
MDTAPETMWPSLPLDEWSDTRDTLQLFTQVVGKVRLSHSPLMSHWWNVPLYVTARGLTTSLMWTTDGRGFEIAFDFIDHVLRIDVAGSARTVALRPRTVSSFYSEVMEALGGLGVDPVVWPMPVEIPGAIPFEEDEVHRSYDREYVERFWRVLISTSLMLHRFRGTYVGKVSPVHLFWGALDLAVTRFSGRTAPPHRGGAPHCGEHVMLEAYSHEVSSAGFWPGGASEGAFYSYAYPEPDGYREATVEPVEAGYDTDLGEFLLPYEVVRMAGDPRKVLMAFLESTYAAAADLGGWDRAALERPLPRWTRDGVARVGPSATGALPEPKGSA